MHRRSQDRALQSFTAANVNDVRIGRGNGECADGAGRLVVENRIPGVSEISGFPNAAVDGSHVENIRLMRHSGDGHARPPRMGRCTASAFRNRVSDRISGRPSGRAAARSPVVQKIAVTIIPEMNHFPAAPIRIRVLREKERILWLRKRSNNGDLSHTIMAGLPQRPNHARCFRCSSCPGRKMSTLWDRL